MIKKIISGGQTGADQGGLEAGKQLGIRTGGTAPFGYRTENGPDPKLSSVYGLSQSNRPDYPPRTKQNVFDGDGTVIFGDMATPGSRLTIKLCRELNKPCLLLGDLECLDEFGTDLNEWIRDQGIEILNVAGNRESKNPGIQEKVKNFLVGVLEGG